MSEEDKWHGTDITELAPSQPNRSEEISELAKALAMAQGQMKGATKDSDNPYFRSKYADLASVWEACRKPLSDNELAIAQLPAPSPSDEILLDTILMHSSGQWVSSRTQIPVNKADAQGYGSALTYARRYALSAMVGIAPEDDDGNAAATAKPLTATQKRYSRTPTPANAGVWESMTEAQKSRLVDVSVVVKEYMEQGDMDSALKELDNITENEEKIALWSRFDSKERSAIKAARQ